MHGGDIYEDLIEYDFSVNTNPLDLNNSLRNVYDKTFFKLQNYPDIEQRGFRKKVACLEGLRAEEIIGGNGASELFLAIVRMINPRRALVLTPSFYGYFHALGSIEGCSIEEYKLKREDDFVVTMDFVEYLKKIRQRSKDNRPEILFLANPNNPTGKNIPSDILELILAEADTLKMYVVIDECFLKLSNSPVSCKKKILEHRRLFVVDAFTKLFCLPGARIGYLCSYEENIRQIKKQLPEWNMSILAQELGCSCVDEIIGTDFINKSVELVKNERNYLTEELMKLKFEVFQSDVNYIFFYSKDELYKKLKDKNILIRDCRDFDGLCNGFYRIAVKKHKQNERLIAAIKEVENLFDMESI